MLQTWGSSYGELGHCKRTEPGKQRFRGGNQCGDSEDSQRVHAAYNTTYMTLKTTEKPELRKLKRPDQEGSAKLS